MDAGRRVGDFATVERHAQVLYELDPLAEEGVRGLMEARAWVGDRSNALKVYARFAAALAEELGAKPSPELARIAGLLREGRRAAPRPAAPAAVAERQEKRFEAEPLIGREAEFATLYDVWLEVRGRTPRIVVVTGEPGVGKTTLTNAFVSTCQMEGAVVARAQAYAAERELPFAVLAELIKQLTLQRAIGGAAPEALSELARVAPEILQAFPGVPRPLEWAAEVIPLRLADAVLKALEAAAEESPVVLVSDDLHAADASWRRAGCCSFSPAARTSCARWRRARSSPTMRSGHFSGWSSSRWARTRPSGSSGRLPQALGAGAARFPRRASSRRAMATRWRSSCSRKSGLRMGRVRC